MKKILSLILVVAMIFTLVACTSNDGNKNPVNGVEDITENTQSTTENQEFTEEGGSETIPSTSQDGEKSDSDDENKSGDEEGEFPVTDNTEGTDKNTPTETTKPNEDEKVDTTKPTENTNPTKHEHKYTSKVTKKATCTEDGLETSTCSCGSTKTNKISKTGHKWGEWVTTKEPTTSTEGNSQRKCSNCGTTENKSIAKLPSTQSYFVKLELVGIEHKNTKYDIDGMNFFDKLYGKNKGGQVGDVFTYEIKTSNGEPIDIRIKDVQNCTYEVNGNILKMTLSKIRVWEKWASLSFYAKDESGNEKVFSTGNISMYMYEGNITENCAVMDEIIELYAQRLGMTRLWGEDAVKAGCTNSDNYDDYDNVKIPNNPNWIREVFTFVDKYHKKGSTVICFMTVGTDGWQGTSN